MSVFGDLLLREEVLRSAPTSGYSRTVIPEEPLPSCQSVHSSVRDEQISGLVEQLFFAHHNEPLKKVAFAPVEASAETAKLCFDVAKALVEQGTRDVGLVDATFDGPALENQLPIPTPAGVSAPWAITSNLWMVPRHSWLEEGGRQSASDRSIQRLRDLTAEFDLCILHCSPVSWLTVRVSPVFDGLVLVLIANRTRRLVAAQVKEQLNKTQISLLGTVLAGRRFPLPNGLYRSL